MLAFAAELPVQSDRVIVRDAIGVSNYVISFPEMVLCFSIHKISKHFWQQNFNWIRSLCKTLPEQGIEVLRRMYHDVISRNNHDNVFWNFNLSKDGTSFSRITEIK